MPAFLPWRRKTQERTVWPNLSINDYLQQVSFQGNQYVVAPQTTLGQKAELPDQSFAGYVAGAYKSNGVVFACMLARASLFAEVRFQYRQIRNGRPGDLFGNQDLRILEEPWPGATTGDLLSRMIQDVDLAGNFYGVNLGDRVHRMRPDWVTVIHGSDDPRDPSAVGIDTHVVGYVYQPRGVGGTVEPRLFLPEEVCHFAPIPDPIARFRGMSWLTPILREIMADTAATTHKLMYFENGATVNGTVSLDPNITKEQFDTWVDAFQGSHQGVLNAYKTLYLGGGATYTPIGSDLKQIDFKAVQGAGETRIAAAAGVPPIIVGLSEGLAAATYSNYGQARRAFADGTMRNLWRNAAGSLSSIISVPADAELWYDVRDVSFLQEDVKDAADIQSVEAATIHVLIAAGFEPSSVIDAVTAGDFERLAHTGLYSVQLQPAGTVAEGKGSVVQGLPVKEKLQLPVTTSNGKPQVPA